MLETRLSRRLVGTVAVAALSVGSVYAWRGTYKPHLPQAPEYRQRGPANAPATLAIFSDFQCPGCAAAVEPVNSLEALYPGRLRVLYKHHPWDFHPYARDAAALAECAGKQGKFWELHDKLFANQFEWAAPSGAHGGPAPKAAESFFLKYAAEAKLDLPALEACRKDPAIQTLIGADLKESDDHWIRSTPTFFVNGRRLVGIKQLRTIGTEEIDRLVKPGKDAR